MEELSEEFPPGLEHRIIYNPTEYVADSINQVYHTLFEAGLLVVLTVFVFLQNWRSVIIPLVAIPVSLIGTFAAMHAIGFSLNSLSLFGLVLAAMCAIFLKPEGAKPNVLDRASKFLFGWFFRAFNRAFDFSNYIYAGTVRRLLRVSAIALLFYAGLLGMTWFSFDRVPMGFIPA